MKSDLPKKIKWDQIHDLRTQLLLLPRGVKQWELLLRDENQKLDHYFCSEKDLCDYAKDQENHINEAIMDRLHFFKEKRYRFAGLVKDKPLLMGIVNVTPDSFSDGGQFDDPQKAINHGLSLMAEGADILDIGGESTRPGAQNVSEDEELNRIMPVVEALVSAGAIISVDTRKASIMDAALKCGVQIINDVSALSDDPQSLDVMAKYPKAHVVLMHKQGQPQNMQDHISYNHLLLDIYDYLWARLQKAQSAGLEKKNLAIDVGIGFGKTTQNNLDLLGQIAFYKNMGAPMVLGASRKSFISTISKNTSPIERIYGSISAALWAAQWGVDVLRVHDVKETKQALDVFFAIQKSSY